MKQLKNFLIKREQSQARLSFAKREKSRLLAKTLLTLVALLAVTTGAWAEEKMVTINSSTMSSGAVTATGFNIIFQANLYVNKNPATITTSEGVITKLVIKKGNVYTDAFTEANVGVTPGTITYGSDKITVTDINAESVTLSRKGDNNWSTSSVDVYYAEPAPSSGPEVDWNKAKNSGTFTMPGGNVTLEPEYYPQATVADGGVTAADADARATTDDPLVKVDATKLTGAKKLMYFVSNSGTTAPAYDAEGWTDQLPNAEGFTQQGIVYVWYYPVGIDEGVDGATATYSDGDILAANALTVTIAAAPTYAVTFAEGVNPEPPAEPEWTASPNTDVTKGQTVTVTYSGTKKVIGVKAEKKAAPAAAEGHALSASAVGEIVGTDGKAYAVADKDNLPEGVTAVAMVAYKSATAGSSLAIALADQGSMRWSTAKSQCAGKTAIGGKSWKLPSQGEWKQMFSANGDNEGQYTGLNTAITNAGGTALASTLYWSSSSAPAPDDDYDERAWAVNLGGGGASWESTDPAYYKQVRACLAF